MKGKLAYLVRESKYYFDDDDYDRDWRFVEAEPSYTDPDDLKKIVYFEVE